MGAGRVLLTNGLWVSGLNKNDTRFRRQNEPGDWLGYSLLLSFTRAACLARLARLFKRD
jgi:hypothetical protein